MAKTKKPRDSFVPLNQPTEPFVANDLIEYDRVALWRCNWPFVSSSAHRVSTNSSSWKTRFIQVEWRMANSIPLLPLFKILKCKSLRDASAGIETS